jgi:hypothetical protein
MAELQERVLAEEQNIARALDQMPQANRLCELNELELAGTAAFLHNFYCGIENILKQVLVDCGAALPDGPSWHRDLLRLAQQKGVLKAATSEALLPFLAFRHFFSHAYALDLEPERMEALVAGAGQVFDLVRRDVKVFMGAMG